MILYILRGVFLLLVASVTTIYLLPYQWKGQVQFAEFVSMMGVPLGLSIFVIAVDMLTPNKKLSAVSGVFLGLLAGLLAAWALSHVVTLIELFVPPPRGVSQEAFSNLLLGVEVLIGLVTCYIGISLVLQTKDDFRFVIPYVDFSKQIRGSRAILLDSSVIIDGRILDIAHTGAVQGPMVVPRFILTELQNIADSSDKLRRARGRRGLEILQKLQESPMTDVSIEESDDEGPTVDQQLLTAAERLQAHLMTGDYNLSKVANLRGLSVINLNDLAQALRPVVLPGETMTVKIIKPGDSAAQGVGYLDDGTMVVVENAQDKIGGSIDLVVTSTLQTSAGRMIFGRFANELGREHEAPESENPADAPPRMAGMTKESPIEAAPRSSSQPRSGRRNPRRRT